MNYAPLNYDQINAVAGNYHPSQVKAYNNKSFAFWERALFQRALSIMDFKIPWDGTVKDFFRFCLFSRGYVAVFKTPEYGLTFQPCGLSGYDWYYRPTNALVANPAMPRSLDLRIGQDCEILKLTPDYYGIWDIIEYYACKLSELDKQQNDVLHFIEKYNLNASDGFKVYKLLKDIRVERRSIKNEIHNAQMLDKTELEGINYVSLIKKMADQEKQDAYTPRILTELFELRKKGTSIDISHRDIKTGT